MSQLSDISITLIEGQENTYYKDFLPELAQALPDSTPQPGDEYITECPDFNIQDILPVSGRHPGLLIEIDVKGENEEDSCRIRVRGEQSEVIQKEYPHFSKLLSTRESAARDSQFFSHLDLEEADKRAIAFLHTHLKKPVSINNDRPGCELVLVCRIENDECFAIDVRKISIDDGHIRFQGVNPATGFGVLAFEGDLVTGQAVLAAQYIDEEI